MSPSTSTLATHPVVRRLAGDLGLPLGGNALAALRAHAVARVHGVVSGFAVSSLSDLQLLVANHLGVCLEYVRDSTDVERIARERRGFSPQLERILRADFIDGDTEGLLLSHPSPGPGQLCYLAVIDCRGERAVRSYFTAWHELAHLLLLPPQLVFTGFRRSPALVHRQKDPLEAVVDDVAGLVGFFEPIFGPALDDAREASAVGALGTSSAHARDGGPTPLTLAAVDAARQRVAPAASFYASGLAAIRRTGEPLALVCAKLDWKPTQRRASHTSGVVALPCLRVSDVVCNSGARGRLRLHRHLRVPAHSVISHAFAAPFEERSALEDQSWWETSARGALAAVPLRVHAARRGPVVYALVEVLDGAA